MDYDQLIAEIMTGGLRRMRDKRREERELEREREAKNGGGTVADKDKAKRVPKLADGSKGNGNGHGEATATPVRVKRERSEPVAVPHEPSPRPMSPRLRPSERPPRTDWRRRDRAVSLDRVRWNGQRRIRYLARSRANHARALAHGNAGTEARARVEHRKIGERAHTRIAATQLPRRNAARD